MKIIIFGGVAELADEAAAVDEGCENNLADSAILDAAEEGRAERDVLWKPGIRNISFFFLFLFLL